MVFWPKPRGRVEILRKIRIARMLFRSDRSSLTQRLGLRSREEEKAVAYLEREGVTPYLTQGAPEEGPANLNKAYDLANLHRIILRLKPRVVIEFGCGFSSLAMGHALKLNATRGKVGRLYVVEASEKWAENVRGKMFDLAPYVEITHSQPELIQVGTQLCHIYSRLPDVRPDFIYLDGPDPNDVAGNARGITAAGLQYACAADPCLYEWGFYPGFQMLVDGRFTNVEFLKRNLKRQYRIVSSAMHNNTLFELIR